MTKKLGVATLGGGCFWCIEAIYKELNGVVNLKSGFSDGTEGSSDSVEAVQFEFDSKIVKYEEIIDIFFHVHDPTTLNRQGYDVGREYRSVIFFHNVAQEKIAKKVMKDVESEGIYEGKFVTEIIPYSSFQEAAQFHQDFYERNPEAAYCKVIIDPKMKKFREKYIDKLKKG